jgi:hypothetical protein
MRGLSCVQAMLYFAYIQASMNSERIGSSFESFLEDDGILDEVDTVARKRVSAWQMQQPTGQPRREFIEQNAHQS